MSDAQKKPNQQSGEKKSKTRRPVHQEHLDEIFTQESVPSWLASVVLHLVLLVIMLLIPAVTANRSAFDQFEYVNIGNEDASDDDLLNDAMTQEFQEEFQRREQTTETEQEDIKFEYDKLYETQAGLETATQSPDLGIATDSFMGMSGGSGFRGDGTGLANYFRGNPGFGRDIGRLRGQGVDLVIAFDSTDSMQPTIDEVKNNIEALIKLVRELVPNTQVGILTYRDYNDEFIVRGLRLGATTEDILKFLEPVNAGGGGVYPECVMLAMRAAVFDNEGRWRQRARRVIILIGDAPPHANEVEETYNITRQFRADGGVVSVIDTSPANRPVHELEQIATLGGGHYNRLVGGDRDASGLAGEMFVQIFGDKYRPILRAIWNAEAGRMR